VRTPTALAAAAGTLVLLAGCGSSSKSTTSSSASAPATSASAAPSRYGAGAATTGASSAAATAVLVSTKHSKEGTVIAAGPHHLTVYLFEADKAGTSACSGACATAWPPVTGRPQAGSGTNAGELATITRSDGTTQVTYHGHPLYFFLKDKDSGDAYGQGVKAFGASWYVLAPSGEKIDKS
jgi:predicted lipoprotein with Yx(FWY)xxD motif